MKRNFSVYFKFFSWYEVRDITQTVGRQPFTAEAQI
jgi:hypothetical protein